MVKYSAFNYKFHSRLNLSMEVLHCRKVYEWCSILCTYRSVLTAHMQIRSVNKSLLYDPEFFE